MINFNFARGHPSKSLLPVDPMKELLGLMQERGDLDTYLNYPSNDAGNNTFLQQLSLFVDQHCADDDFGNEYMISQPCETNEFFATHGVSHAIELICGTQTEPGDIVALEVPTYFLVSRIFENHGLELKPLPMKDGLMLDVSLLEEMLEKGEMKVPRIIYTIPSYQNPMASTLPVGDRRKLARLAERHGIIVVADEVYHMLDWRDGARPARMASFNSNESCPTKGCCLSVSSFTKIFCPGVRCGWVEGPPHIIQSLKEYGYIRSQGGCVPFVGEAMRIALESGIANKVLADLRSAYKERANVLCRILKEGDIPVVVRPLGGYFLCIKLSVHATKFSSYCTERGLKFLPGTSCDPFSLIESPHSYYGRLCFADLPMSELEQGARRLVHLWKEFQEGNL